MNLRNAWLLALAVAVTPALADEKVAPRIAVVDLTAAFEAHPRTAKATAELTAARKAARKNFREKSSELKDTLQRHQELLREGRKSEAAAELEKVNALERSIAELGTTNQRDLEERFRTAKKEILDDIARVVREFNAEKGYALVLDKLAASGTGLPQVLDAWGADDLAAPIIPRLKPLAAA